MSWEHATCPNCTARMARKTADYDAEGRIVMGFICRECGTESSLPEPDDNFRSRQELAAKEASP